MRKGRKVKDAIVDCELEIGYEHFPCDFYPQNPLVARFGTCPHCNSALDEKLYCVKCNKNIKGKRK